MREFIVYCTKASKPDSRNIPEGRFDVIARCTNAALWTSHGLRESKIHFFLAPVSKIISFDPAIRQVSPDERSIAMWIDKILEGRTNPGISAENGTFEDLMRNFGNRNMYLMDEAGKDIAGCNPDENGVFILGDHDGIPEDVKEKITAERISIGPRSYLASHCISYINILLDRIIM